WTRLHATKDYLDTARALEEFPDIKATVNLVPSLLLQLKEYASGNVDDRILHLTRTPAFLLKSEEKLEIVKGFFQCNVQQMILPYARYAELYRNVGESVEEPSIETVESFSPQDWLDLQVWYLLTWVGPYAREENPLFSSLIEKGAGFSEREKLRLIDATLDLIAKIIPLWKKLQASAQVELSVSPFYHPILPLLIDLAAARESIPDEPLPNAESGWEEDASLQIASGVQYFANEFEVAPRGMWPSEGSISERTLELIRSEGIEWIASDETVLKNSLRKSSEEEAISLPHCFPWTYKTESGDIHLFFRDHDLSDRVGFLYASWNAEDAADDFIQGILERRNRLVEEFGEDILEDAVLPVILDGENCWEYYQENGKPFLEALYRKLSESDEIETVTFSQVVEQIDAENERVLSSLQAGSWIGGNFRIWIGEPEENQAWEALAHTREVLMEGRENVPSEKFFAAYEELLIAEGSDWFWWYGDENTTVNDPLFDQLFREHLQNVYQLIGKEVPENLYQPIRHYSGKWKHGGAMHRAEFNGDA
ncbi:MAG: glycoside hydrolase, partial [Candidatus Kapaibacterium sp.]